MKIMALEGNFLLKLSMEILNHPGPILVPKVVFSKGSCISVSFWKEYFWALYKLDQKDILYIKITSRNLHYKVIRR